MSKSDTKLEIKFENDLKQILLAQFKNAGYLFNTKSITEDVFRQYFNVIFREISHQPRKVRISKELQGRLPTGNQKTAFDDIVAKASSGGRLNQYLSMERLKPEYKDLLLYDWRIHHLHLGVDPDKGDPRFIARTDELLYVRVENDGFYCIDILDHDLVNGFANQKLIQIIHDNFPETGGKLFLQNHKKIRALLTILKVGRRNLQLALEALEGYCELPCQG